MHERNVSHHRRGCALGISSSKSSINQPSNATQSNPTSPNTSPNIHQLLSLNGNNNPNPKDVKPFQSPSNLHTFPLLQSSPRRHPFNSSNLGSQLPTQQMRRLLRIPPSRTNLSQRTHKRQLSLHSIQYPSSRCIPHQIRANNSVNNAGVQRMRLSQIT
jgi:hypothetical protein